MQADERATAPRRPLPKDKLAGPTVPRPGGQRHEPAPADPPHFGSRMPTSAWADRGELPALTCLARADGGAAAGAASLDPGAPASSHQGPRAPSVGARRCRSDHAPYLARHGETRSKAVAEAVGGRNRLQDDLACPGFDLERLLSKAPERLRIAEARRHAAPRSPRAGRRWKGDSLDKVAAIGGKGLPGERLGLRRRVRR